MKQPYQLELIMKLLALFLLACIALIACVGNIPERQLSLEQAKSDLQIHLPVRYPDPATSYAAVSTNYYYYDRDSELQLDTYFVSVDQDGNSTRVAKMSTYNVAGQLVTPEEIMNGEVQIKWAQGETARKCKVILLDHKQEPIPGGAYQTCLYWFGQDGYRYKMYSTWSEDETANFVNTLIEIAK
jgi:hypothetical protein